MTSGSHGPDDIDTEGRTLPPYEGRRESADVADESASVREGATVGGATGPVEDSEMKAPGPENTPRGATGSPADEQPAADMQETDLGDDRTGPAHTAGVDRAEDQP